jgi:hypothetical protein
VTAARLGLFMRTPIPTRYLFPAMSDEEALDLTNQPTLLTRDDVDYIVSTTERGLTPDGNVAYILIKNFVPYEFCEAAYSVALKAASQPVIGGTRAIAAGAYMEPRTRKDGSKGNRTEVPDLPHLHGAKHGIVGFYDKPECRLTAFSARDWEGFQETLPLLHCLNGVFREYMPLEYANQAEAAGDIEKQYVIEGTVFTTITINRNFRTAVHLDEGDFENGFGVLTMLSAGEFCGGELALPQYRVAIDFQMQDVLLLDVHRPHGNLPLEGVDGEYERVSLVCYLREAMLRRCPAAS